MPDDALIDLDVDHLDWSTEEPVAFLWAIGQIAAGHDRLFRRPEFSAGVAPLLASFRPGASTVEDVLRRLSAHGLWETADDRSGFTRLAADRLADRGFRARVVDVIRRDHITTIVDFGGLLTEVGLADRDTALNLLRSLIGVPLSTVDGHPNEILAVRDRAAVVATGRSPEGRPVPVAAVQTGLDLLRENGVVSVRPAVLGYRSAFVGAVLRTLPDVVVTKRPATIALAAPSEPPVADVPTFAVLDGTTEVRYRKEQGSLRRLLAGDRSRAECDLCGHEFPIGMLVAAHVKLRSRCTDEERNDLRNVAMLACAFGCDHLYENGYLAVDGSGLVVVVEEEVEGPGRLGEHLRGVRGRTCTAHRPASAGYFAWHHENKFRG